MTATLAPTSPVRPRIAYFWWLREANTSEPAADASSYVPTDRNYIPAGTADMWRRCAPRSFR